MRACDPQWLLSLVGLALASSKADAMQFKRVPIDPPVVAIEARGPIISGDFERLVALFRSLPKTDQIGGFIIDSPGGSVVEAEKIAHLLSATRAMVIIPAGAECSSACFLLFASAARRVAAPDALIGVHSASHSGREDTDSLAITTLLARDAADYGVAPAIIGKMVQTPPGRTAWLTPDDLASMDVVILNQHTPTPHSASPPVALAPPYSAPSPEPVAAPVSPAISDEPRAFQEGLRDRTSWEQWFGTITGEYHDGAAFWAAHRSDPKPPPCYGTAGQNLGDYTAGCVAEQQRLAASDVRRKTEPDYRRGWNGY